MQIGRIRKSGGNVGRYALTRVTGIAVVALAVAILPVPTMLMSVRRVLVVGRVHIPMVVVLMETQTIVCLDGC